MEEEKEIQIKEAKGLWKASSYVRRIAKRFFRNKQPAGIRYLLEAHRRLFWETNERSVAGKYRINDPTIIRIDGSKLKVPHWSQVPNQMAQLDEELKKKSINLVFPQEKKDYIEIIDLAAKTSHKLACIHPFHNGNGRISRLLINFILYRADLTAIAIKEKKSEYLRAMLQADEGDFSPLRSLVIKALIVAQNKKIEKQKNLLPIKEEKKQKKLIPYKYDFKNH